MSTKILLALLGVGKGNIMEKLLGLALDYGKDSVKAELTNILRNRTTAKRRTELVLMLNEISAAIAKNQDDAAVKRILDLLTAIRL